MRGAHNPLPYPLGIAGAFLLELVPHKNLLDTAVPAPYHAPYSSKPESDADYPILRQFYPS